MIIYKITNLLNKKAYIGQSKHPFNKRYKGGKWWEYSSNDCLVSAAKKYGHVNFSIEILESNVENKNRLDELEAFYARKFNTYTPYGYNIRGCGSDAPITEEMLKRIRSGRKFKIYYLRKISTWEMVEVKNLKAFCNENNLSLDSLRQIVSNKGSVITSGGFCSISKNRTEIELHLKKCKFRFDNSPVDLVDKNGELIHVANPREFIKENNLNKDYFYGLLRGRNPSYAGFKLFKNKDVLPKNIHHFTLCYQLGDPISFSNAREFAEMHKLHYGTVLRLLNGEIKTCVGWHLPGCHPRTVLSGGSATKEISIDLLDPDCNLVRVDDLFLFCKENNLPYLRFYQLSMGYSKTYKGWAKLENKHLFSTLISPEGVVFKTAYIIAFCKKHGLSHNQIYKVLNPLDKATSHKGWTGFRCEKTSD